ncbi:hypothetical protein BKA57DRAFT_455616 [Linnemannia elongata]|nr:hypothetical protein BKA57DRAFT_455616 [Linnemannia elongata]
MGTSADVAVFLFVFASFFSLPPPSTFSASPSPFPFSPRTTLPYFHLSTRRGHHYYHYQTSICIDPLLHALANPSYSQLQSFLVALYLKDRLSKQIPV